MVHRTISEAIARRRWRRRASGPLAVPRRPATFNEKVRYKMLNDQRPLLTTFADKVAARDYIAGIVGETYLPDVYLVSDDADTLTSDALPREFALKVSHASGGSVLVSDLAPGENVLPEPSTRWERFLVAPESVDWEALRELFRSWLLGRYKARKEWAYRAVPPRVLAEELLHERGELARDYKFLVVHGRVRLIWVDLDRWTNHVRTLYTPDWELLPVSYRVPRGPEVERPASLTEMTSVAEALARETDLLRVDMYYPGHRLVVGELTSYPVAGRGKFDPVSFDLELGSAWAPPRRYR